MAKGILYVMTSVVDGVVKIGKTGSDHFGQRMNYLERNGYRNVGGLQRKFAIEVEDYDEKEKLVNEIFSKSKISNSELFALDVDLVVQLLASFEGRQVYPETVSKEDVFIAATAEYQIKSDWALIPDGEYYLTQTVKCFGQIDAKMRVESGSFVVLKGCLCAPTKPGWVPEARKTAPIVDSVLQEDVPVKSPSVAGWIVLGHSNNGWMSWKDQEGNPIDKYRQDV